VGEHEEVEGNLLVCSVGARVAGVGLPAVSRSSDEVCDEDITPMDIQEVSSLDIQTIQAPITRARARQLNLQVSSLLSVSVNNCENSLLPNFYNVIRNQGEVQGAHGEEHGGVEEQQGPPSHMETQSNLTSSASRSPGAA
jgi:hypothetical protein